MTAPCVHRWRLADAGYGPEQAGTCSLCGATRCFSGGVKQDNFDFNRKSVSSEEQSARARKSWVTRRRGMA